MSYRCPSCQSVLDDAFCPDCSVLADEIREESAAPASVALPPLPEPPSPQSLPGSPSEPPPVAATKSEGTVRLPDWGDEVESLGPRRPSTRHEAEVSVDELVQRSQTQETPTPRQRRAELERLQLDGRDLVEQDLADGFELFLIAGVGGSGKTELLAALSKLDAGFLQDFDRDELGRVTRTTVRSIHSRHVRAPGRKLSFIDAPGELFVDLYPLRDADGYGDSYGGGQIELWPQLIAQRFRGMILVIDLEKLWSLDGPAEWRQQIEIAAWVLEVMRWLQHDGHYPSGSSHQLHQYIDRQVRGMKKKLSVPVQVVFTKADVVKGTPIPNYQRRLYPVGEDPVLFAFHCLPKLHDALVEHVAHFRYDFTHAIVTDGTTGAATQRPPCGVRLSMDWLLDAAWARQHWWQVTTGGWLRWQRLVDLLTGKRERWKRLPDPEPLDSP